ncbi:hypothetical protein Rsub_01733 [Raphidocelis subcapitata]|uniref:Uncharacterized protein n=1 Tax=Raphidocelis subcapitata TaxID=307507 RepID=A0A2V0NQF4_9CHLO|nr:hypothetical protein Rsub_01733 [Raphidocelis subcapitata]|eukprot:GBF88832.1 hypothetical protein Rsub_01733 [Raphidocelis subcapitata]
MSLREAFAAAAREAAAAASPLAVAPRGSVAASAAASAAFLALALPAAYSLKRTRFKTYVLLFASLLLRGVGYALHGAAIDTGDARREAAFQALRAAGFGMAVGVSALCLFSWFKNSAPRARPFGARAAFAGAMAARATLPVVILAGPVMGAIAQAAAALHVRAASLWALLAALAVVNLLCALAATSYFLGAARARARRAPVGGGSAGGDVWGDPHALIVLPVAATLLLDVAMAQRLAGLLDARAYANETLFYLCAALPEVLAAALLAPPLVLARLCMCGDLNRHLAAVGLPQLPEVSGGSLTGGAPGAGKGVSGAAHGNGASGGDVRVSIGGDDAFGGGEFKTQGASLKTQGAGWN